MNISATANHAQAPIQQVHIQKSQEALEATTAQKHSTPTKIAPVQAQAATSTHTQSVQHTYNTQGATVQHAVTGQKIDVRG